MTVAATDGLTALDATFLELEETGSERAHLTRPWASIA